MVRNGVKNNVKLGKKCIIKTGNSEEMVSNGEKNNAKLGRVNKKRQ